MHKRGECRAVREGKQRGLFKKKHNKEGCKRKKKLTAYAAFSFSLLFLCVKKWGTDEFQLDLFVCLFVGSPSANNPPPKKHLSLPGNNSKVKRREQRINKKEKEGVSTWWEGRKKQHGCVSQESSRLFSLFDLNWQPKLPLHKWLQAAGGGSLSFTQTPCGRIPS